MVRLIQLNLLILYESLMQERTDYAVGKVKDYIGEKNLIKKALREIGEINPEQQIPKIQ